MKPVLVLQHVEAEGPGAIGSRLVAAGLELDVRHMWSGGSRGSVLPRTLRDHAALVIMGGPMAVHSDAGFPTRGLELALAREAIDRDLPTLGVCLGAQLIAVAAGGHCYRGPVSEIGWYPIRLTAATQSDPLLRGLGGSLTVFHWHGDTFSFPVDRPVLLADSDRYPNQAFRIGKHVWGLQCHPEVDEATVVAMVEAGRAELDELAVVGRGATAAVPANAILAATPAAMAELESPQTLIFDRFAEVVRGWSVNAESN